MQPRKMGHVAFVLHQQGLHRLRFSTLTQVFRSAKGLFFWSHVFHNIEKWMSCYLFIKAVIKINLSQQAKGHATPSLWGVFNLTVWGPILKHSITQIIDSFNISLTRVQGLACRLVLSCFIVRAWAETVPI